MLVLLTAGVLTLPSPALAASLTQDDSAGQCAEGLELFFGKQHTEALLLLEACFADLNNLRIRTRSDQLGTFALALGRLRDNAGDRTGALEAYAVALEVFQSSGPAGIGQRGYEAATLSNMGLVYHEQGRYAEALESYQQALTIWQEVDDWAGEERALNGIGAVCRTQERYGAEVLEPCQQALAIPREVVDNNKFTLTLILLGNGLLAPAHAVPTVQDDLTSVQCIEGVRLFRERQYAEARPLLEAGFASREIATFSDINDLGRCALDLGLLRDIGDRIGALEAYTVALEIFQASGNQELEGTALSKIGDVYYAQGRYAEALKFYQQALTIERELGNRVSEGETLNDIGVVYAAQGRYAEALDACQQALFIALEDGNWVGKGAALNGIGLVHWSQVRVPMSLSSRTAPVEMVDVSVHV